MPFNIYTSFLLLFFCNKQNVCYNPLYKIKSAVIHYQSSNYMPPGKRESVIFFDEFGKKQLIKVKNTMGQLTEEQRIIIDDDVQYMMTDTTQCIKTKRKRKFSLENIDISLLKEDTKIKYGIKKLIDTNYLGKACSRYGIDYKSENITGEIVEWNNILLQIILKKDGSIIEETKAYKLEVKSSLSSSLFKVPTDIEVLDMTGVDNN